MKSIKEVADMFGITTDTIRYYEQVGVIPTITRGENGYRQFTTQDINWVFLAKSLRSAGVSIESLIQFTLLSQVEGDERLAQKDILKEQLVEVDSKLEEMMSVRNLLQYKIDTYDEHIARINEESKSNERVEELWNQSFRVKK
ncbi:MerR family transcriptional regulator [Marinilactibacillus psychrotolerans]|uniref:MerR family transcriptional regulator n=1 Tax=Marinilactibacillus psychrotolerans TaxID=191770 RepID=A0AAV3WQ77_9LACT|nr:MerR family transcriptional regulator [Marinilactibacillus psychrotolerans]GEL67920.1 MerR family transcriptional regulator [Marinilactibacillus psychrotolerans]GEQ35361.1 MerR family transcriptional regulator [Marinilactibacillus psychrotolerans]SDD25911.1 DNA-binding transcriptional regulator, MerR family [Marinilactibacillus psychrotolerans]